MGIWFVLVLYAMAGGLLSLGGMVVLREATAFWTRGATSRRRGVILAASWFPFVCLGWAGAVFMFQWTVNESVFHRDPGLGDSWKCPLPNGYALSMIDVPDHGCVYNPKTQATSVGVIEQEDAVFDVCVLQLARPCIARGTTTN